MVMMMVMDIALGIVLAVVILWVLVWVGSIVGVVAFVVVGVVGGVALDVVVTIAKWVGRGGRPDRTTRIKVLGAPPSPRPGTLAPPPGTPNHGWRTYRVLD